RQATVQDGLAFVPLSRGEVFGVKLINRSPYDAAVTLTIDGINMYAFSKVKDPSTGRPKFSVVVLGPGEEAFVPGWHRTNEVSEEFVITEYARSAAAELHSNAPTGVITATFAAAWPKDQAPPADEPGGQGGYSRSADAVGRGAKVQKKYVA